ncbi:MAG: DUF3048 C-terminal domain-containing protein [Anaerolineaceae bacterium]|nr:DUF3048 C-terminal domain-containing protein [Anaerolineaceae bacterium]
MKRLLILIMVAAVLLSGCSIMNYFPAGEIVSKDAAEEKRSDILVDEEINNKKDGGKEGKIEQKENTNRDLEDLEKQVELEKNPVDAINPLTGLQVSNPENLQLPPALVSITNFPPTARPQAGLTASPMVFELFIGDGMTRYLALFYGDCWDTVQKTENPQGDLTEGVQEPNIGPVRSGRIPYEYIRQLYSGFIVMASAYEKVAAQLKNYKNVYGGDPADVNSAMVSFAMLEQIARESGKEIRNASLSGMQFSEEIPREGKEARSLWLFYAYKNQVFWRYNTDDHTYHRWQDNADGCTFIEQTDRLNGEPLTYENVIVLFADHEVENKYIIDVDLLYVKRGKALLFRDGFMYDIYWTTKSEEYEKTTGKLRPIRFIDAEGNPFPLKPGQTWIELIPTHSPYWETVDSEKYHILVNGRSKGSGYWAVYFKIDY